MLQFQLHIEARKNKLNKLRQKHAKQQRAKAEKKTLKVDPSVWTIEK